MRYFRYGVSHEELVVTLVKLGRVEVLASGGMLGLVRHDMRITPFNFVLIIVGKLASKSTFIFSPWDTCLILKSLKVDISFFVSFKYLFILSTLALKVSLT